MKHLNHKLYTDLAIDELDGRLTMEELEDKLEMACWGKCDKCNVCSYSSCPGDCPRFVEKCPPHL